MRRTLLGIFAGLVIGVALTAGVGIVRGQTSEGDTNWVPDIEQIYFTALGNVFDAAGEKFTDPELKEFYDRLTGEITEKLATPVPFDPGIEIPTPTPEPTVVPTVAPAGGPIVIQFNTPTSSSGITQLTLTQFQHVGNGS